MNKLERIQELKDLINECSDKIDQLHAAVFVVAERLDEIDQELDELEGDTDGT